MLVPQPNARYVRDNLLTSHRCGAELHSCGAISESALNKPLVYLATMCHLIRCRLKNGRYPYLIPPGGSSLPGITGFVNAAFELRRQIADGEMPKPDCIYVACGTMGTTAGLLLGLRAAKLDTHVVSVRVTSARFVNPRAMIRLIGRANSFLHSSDASFPVFEFSATDIDIRNECFGKRYALFTEEGMKAVSLMREREGLELDGTYTGKALVAMIRDAENRVLRGKSVLFWNTLNSRSHPEAEAGLDYRELPRCFHRYFREDPQPLDRDGKP
jgi:1-aminocyclopropane-1-carboxylate deaminase/D-cysteine desulfhydrase-like pyridoxal-dependent ACC family enzyme